MSISYPLDNDDNDGSVEERGMANVVIVMLIVIDSGGGGNVIVVPRYYSVPHHSRPSSR